MSNGPGSLAPTEDLAQPTQDSLTLVLPAYNEEAPLGPALDELFSNPGQPRSRTREATAGLARLPSLIRVLVVDDGSTDQTAGIVLASPASAPGIREADLDGPWNGAWLELLPVAHEGKGATVRAGGPTAGEYVIFADVDMATPPSEIPLLPAALRTSDVALGSSHLT